MTLAAAMMLCTTLSAQTDARRLATQLEQGGQTAEAAAAWKAIAEQHPGEAEPWAHVGQLEARQEHYAESIRAYRKALAIAPSMPGLRPNLGLSYFKNGDYHEAIAMFAPLLKASPQDEKLNLLAGMSYYGLGGYAAAIPFLQRAAAHDQNNLTLQLTLAHSCLFAKQFPCVLDAYHKMVALNAESAEADMLAGEALDAMHEDVAAMREMEAAVKANPKEPNVHFALGYLRWKKGQYAGAAEEFEAELSNGPQHAQAMRYLGNCDLQMNKLDEAQALLEKVIRLDPANGMEHRDLGFVYAEKQRNEDAVRELRAAARLTPKDVSVHYRLGRLYKSMGKTTEAKAELIKAATLNKQADEELLKVMSAAPGKNSGSGPAK